MGIGRGRGCLKAPPHRSNVKKVPGSKVGRAPPDPALAFGRAGARLPHVTRIRPPAVAGSFYPADPDELRALVRACLAAGAGRPRGAGPAGDPGPGGEARPKALIVPHAGFVYSGPIAGSAYARLAPFADAIRRVVLLGPSHRVGFEGLALSSAERFATPLGEIPLDADGAEVLLRLPQVRVLDAAHSREHSLEVQLPFLQEVLGAFVLLPVVAGDAAGQEVAEVIEAVWGGDETLRPEGLHAESACGRVPVRGLLVAARRHHLAARTLDLRSSGDTAGPREQVVGYGAYAFA
jgi:AmmeMemoRadiSam system protein B